MQESLATIQQLLREIAEHLQTGKRSDKTTAAAKLHRIAAVAATAAFTVAAANR